MGTAPSTEQRGMAAWVLLLGSSLLYFFSINEADNDLWGHLLFGRDILTSGTIATIDPYAYTTAGLRWVNHEWLSQVLLAAVYRLAGSPGLLLLKLAVGTATFLLLYGLVRQRAGASYIRGGLGVLTIAVLARGFSMRPQIFTYCGVALTLALLDRYARGKRGALWVLPGVFLCWANLHGGFVLGLAILGLFAAAGLLSEPAAFGRWIVLVAALVVTAFNPNGPRLLLYVASELGRSHPITEWQPTVLSEVAQWVFFAMLGLFLATLPFFRRWREDGWQIVLALGAALLALQHQRHTPVFALSAAAPLAAQLQQVANWVQERPFIALGRGARHALGLGVVVLAVVQLTLTGWRWRDDGLRIVFDSFDYPTAAVRAMQKAGLQANLAVPLEWGEYVLWFLAPQIKVSLDGRFATLFPEEVVEDNFNFFGGANGWRRLLDRYPTEAALLPAGSGCPLVNEPGWQRVYGDAIAQVYVRSDRAQGLRLATEPAAPGIFP